jgi:hypothetical protein
MHEVLWSLSVLALAVIFVWLAFRKVKNVVELRVKVKDTYADVVSPQLPGASSAGGSDTAAIGNYIKTHGARLGIRVVYE